MIVADRLIMPAKAGIQLILISFFFITTCHAADDAAAKINWGYKGNIGPEFWSQLDPSFTLCANGKEQSPINIPRKVTKVTSDLTIKYSAAPIRIIENGLTTLMVGDKQTIINDGHTVQLNFPAEQTQEMITINKDNYHLVQFHFHSPSETEWRGRAYPIEIHFVHQAEHGKLAVMGVFVIAGKENTTLQHVIDHLPARAGEELTFKDDQINPGSLLPAKLNYYQFVGSLTTPPCSEGVLWMVMANPITASPAQIVKIRQAMGGSNARPVQDLYNRIVTFAKLK